MNKLIYIWLLGFFAVGHAFCAETIHWSAFGENYQKKILPFYYNTPQGLLWGRSDAMLIYKVFRAPQEKGAIVFVTGWTETHLKYAELIQQMVAEGYSVYTVDNRGMGFSSHLVNNYQIVHVDKFSDYVDDLKQFVDRVVNKTKHRKLYFVSHSLGGLIVAHYMARYPWDMDAAVFSSPLFEVNTGKIPESVAYDIAQAATDVGLGKHYAPGQHDVTLADESFYGAQTATHSKERWAQKVDNWRRHPTLLQGGSSNRWVAETLAAASAVNNGLLNNTPVPMLIFQAGEDTRVVISSEDKACRNAPHCQLVRFDHSFHEIFLETDSIRGRALSDMFRFLEKN